MDCKNLMVGDWVSCNDLKRQVASIGETVGFLDCNNQVYWAYEGFDRIDPIPLTEDILVKNGFERSERWHYLTTKISNKKITIQLGCGGKIDYVRVLEQNEIQPFTTYYLDAVFSNIHYVHQLQHLLRLCGIEKEIEL